MICTGCIACICMFCMYCSSIQTPKGPSTGALVRALLQDFAPRQWPSMERLEVQVDTGLQKPSWRAMSDSSGSPVLCELRRKPKRGARQIPQMVTRWAACVVPEEYNYIFSPQKKKKTGSVRSFRGLSPQLPYIDGTWTPGNKQASAPPILSLSLASLSCVGGTSGCSWEKSCDARGSRGNADSMCDPIAKAIVQWPYLQTRTGNDAKYGLQKNSTSAQDT